MKNQNGSGGLGHITSSQLIRYIFLVFCVVLIGVVISACASTSAGKTETDENAFVVAESELLNKDKVSQIVEVEETEEPEILEESEDSEEAVESGTPAETPETFNEPEEAPESNSESEESSVIEEEPAPSESNEPEQNTDTAQQLATVTYDETEQSEPSLQANTETSTPTYTYTDKSETMYTTAALNVRSGPSVDYGIIGTYSAGTSVNVTGVCNETGWSRVDYNGTVGYCSTDYLTDTKPAQAKTTTQASSGNNADSTNNGTTNDNTTNGTTTSNGAFPLYNYGWLNGQYLGRLRIPSLGINVAIYNTNSQSVVDAYDSAAFFAKGDTASQTLLCADHGSQDFGSLYNCTVGTKLYIDAVDGKTYIYICDWVDYNGYNNGQRLYFADGSIASNSNGNLICYVCNPGSTGESITMCHFYPV